MSFARTILAAAAATGLSGLAPASAATVTDDAAAVSLFAGDIIAESYAPVSDAGSLDPVYALIAGGIAGYEPAFVLTLEDASGEELYGEADAYSFDGEKELSFLFSMTGAAADVFGNAVQVSLRFADALADPFGQDSDLDSTAMLTIAPADVAPVPLPAGLPMLAVALAGSVFVLRRRPA